MGKMRSKWQQFDKKKRYDYAGMPDVLYSV